ncbi:uncharacterized protein L3040_003858 [Drepanopeziza brunnea f. sp. 'multigermtubi']|nr:hypothetical protein L3040_003858 [Drepanopeziza brunnea f. sp. 'multigermtubi']
MPRFNHWAWSRTLNSNMASPLQHAGQAQIFSAPSDNVDAQIEDKNSPSTFHKAIAEAAPAVAEDPHDSGFFEVEDSVAPEMAYKDFTLYPEDDRSEIEVPIYGMFADIDAATGLIEGDTSHNSGVKSDDYTLTPQRSAEEGGPSLSNTLSGGIIEGVNEDVYEVLETDYEICFQPGYFAPSPPDVSSRDPFARWLGTYHRHEESAYLLERPPYLAHNLEKQ